jgi:hypothetical protein
MSMNIDERCVYSDSKTYQSCMSLKDDAYYRTEKYEYRITTNPIKVEIRLTERLDEPPERYSVKDGVVLESDIRTQRKFRADEFIDDRRKEVEWHKEPWWVGDSVSMYILSKHPEIISQEDYRRHLRQLSEKIKTAIQKVEKALESDSTGLQITDEDEKSGRTIWIWYPKSKHDQMSEQEIKKAIEHQRTIRERLFDETSKEYVGISESEFSSSVDILQHIDVFLNKKPALAKRQESQKVSFWVKVGAFIIQWIWLFVVVSVTLWLLSMIVTIIHYDFTAAFFVSGIVALFLTLLRSR